MLVLAAVLVVIEACSEPLIQVLAHLSIQEWETAMQMARCLDLMGRVGLIQRTILPTPRKSMQLEWITAR